MIIRILWLTRRDFLNFKTTNQGGQLGIRMSVEKLLRIEQKKNTGAIIENRLQLEFNKFPTWNLHIGQFIVGQALVGFSIWNTQWEI